MQFVILGLLLRGPLSAYEVRKRFTAGISLFYSASLGSIQRALQALDAQGWVTQDEVTDSGRPKHLFTITESGQRAWRDWMGAPVTDSDAEQTTLAKVFLLGSLPPEARADSLAHLRERADADLERLTALRADIQATPAAEPLQDVMRYRLATLDYGIRAHELMVRWLNELESA